MESISTQELRKRLDEQPPNNADRRQGYALVNVLTPESFVEEHIPGSVNIPKGNESEFERRFAKDKEIIVYCASRECNASESVADRLEEMGFTNVADYEVGMKGWNESRGRSSQNQSAGAGA